MRLKQGAVATALLVLAAMPAQADNRTYLAGSGCLAEADTGSDTVLTRQWGQLYNNGQAGVVYKVDCPLNYENDASTHWYPSTVTVHIYQGASSIATSCSMDGTTDSLAGISGTIGSTTGVSTYQTLTKANPLGVGTTIGWLGMSVKCTMADHGTTIQGIYSYYVNSN